MPRAFGHMREDERSPADFYPTPDRLAQACVQAISTICPNPPVIIEPSAGAGAFVRGIRAVWPDDRANRVIAVEMRGEEREGLLGAGATAVAVSTLEEFLPTHWPPAGTLVIGNPPYSLAQEHTMLLLDYLLPGSRIAFLLKCNFLSGKGRADILWKQGQCRFVWPIVGRPSFVSTERATNDTNEYAMFVWEVGYSGLPVVMLPHIRWKEERCRKARPSRRATG